MLFSKDYLDDILVRAAHHSSAIENNTISLAETVSILVHNTIPHQVSLRELYEVDNHRYALDYVLQSVQEKTPFSLHIVREIHYLLLDRLHHEPGTFKSEDNAIVGAEFQTASVTETPMLMQQWIDNVDYRLKNASSKQEIIEVICDSHIRFERIHPFQDGNGRTGRLIMLYLCLLYNLPPLIIHKEDKAAYFMFLAEEDVQGFTAYALGKIEEEQLRKDRFVD